MNDDGMTTIGILHPGAMGSSIGAAAQASGARVVWVSEDRSEATMLRAKADGFEDVHWLNGVVNQSQIILSVCPPEFAVELANEVCALGYRGIYVDANATTATMWMVGSSVDRRDSRPRRGYTLQERRRNLSRSSSTRVTWR
jgi:3-hydroxyisobutyrate dehydrogenase-like beta-hydroxyacid dehydrogenase